MKSLALAVGALILIGATPPPRQMKPPLKHCDSTGHVAPSNRIIVQGGTTPRPNDLAALGPKPDDPAALGPKQDDPGPPPSPDLRATRVGGRRSETTT